MMYMQQQNVTTRATGPHAVQGVVIDIDAPGVTREAYEALNDELFGAGLPEGLRFHAAWPRDGGYRIMEIWESRDAWDAYLSGTLGPVLARHGAPEPALTIAGTTRTFLRAA